MPKTSESVVRSPQTGARAPVLDWRSPAHWRTRPGPCRYCGLRTNLRDLDGLMAHKLCAEAAGAAAQGLGRAAGLAAARDALAEARAGDE